MSQIKDDFALNCGFQHQGGAMSTIAPAVLETELQFPFTHPGSSFLDAFLEKHIPSSSGRLSTPWVPLNFQLENIAFLQGNYKGKKEALVRANNKRNEGLQAVFALGCFRYACLTQTGRTGTGIQESHSKRIGNVGKAECKAFSHALRPSLFFPLYPFRYLSRGSVPTPVHQS
jgi:hypothetical protein